MAADLKGSSFEQIIEGTETRIKCLLCGAVIDAAQTGDHKCPALKKVQCPVHPKYTLEVTKSHATVPIVKGRCVYCDRNYWWATAPFEPVMLGPNW
jgi:hypothetical protein